MGSVDCDEYNELESVIDWLLNVINFNLFVNNVDYDNFANWDDTQTVILPRHLFTNNPRDFWLGICSILTIMTKSCIQTFLLSSDSCHKEFVELVLGLLGEDPDKEYNIPNFHSQTESYRCKNTIFWPVLHCFVLLVDKLGSRFWMCTTTTPNSVLNLIKSNPYYQSQLEICYNQAAQLDMALNSNQDFSFSQLVYDVPSEKSSEPVEPLQERYHGFSLSWVVPFIKSLIDFGDYESSTVVELLDFVCHVHSVSLHGDANVSSTDLFQTVLPIEAVAVRLKDLYLPQESLKCISQSVDVLFSQKVYSVLLQCKQAIFCMITVLCSHVLSRGKKLDPKINQIRQHLSQTARTYVSLVMYCSTEKTASNLWYLVKQISSLSPFLSTVSSQMDSPYSCTNLLHPDDLCKTLLTLIADKEDNLDIAGPFLHPPSFDNSSFKKRRTSSVSSIKQESIGQDTNNKSCTAKIKQESLLDRDLYQSEFIFLSDDSGVNIAKQQNLTPSEKTLDSCSVGVSNKKPGSVAASKWKQISLKLEKLPIKVSKSEKGILLYENTLKNNIVESSGLPHQTLAKPYMLQGESDTETCSPNSDDDNDDELPSFFQFSKRRFTGMSTSSTDSDFNEQKTTAKETKSAQLSSQNPYLERIEEVENTNASAMDVTDFSSSECCTLKQSSEQHHSKVVDSTTKFKNENNLKHNKTISIVDQQWCNDNAQSGSNERSSSIIDMFLSGNSPSSSNSIENCAVNDQHVSESTGENVFTDSEDEDEDVFCSVTSQDSSKLAPMDKQQQSINSEIDMKIIADDPESAGSKNEQGTKSYKLPTVKADNDFVVIPIKHCKIKFKSQPTETTINLENFDEVEPETDLQSSDEVTNQVNSLNNHKDQQLRDPGTDLESFDETINQVNSVINHKTSVPHLQQRNAMFKQQMLNDKIPPAVAGRAPFSKSRMPSLPIPSILSTFTKAQSDKSKAIIPTLQKKTPQSMDQSSATTDTCKAQVKVELSKNHSKEEFLMDVLSWNPIAFFQRKGNESINNEGPPLLSAIKEVPVTFKSSDHYIEVFKPLLLLETWDTVSYYTLDTITITTC